LDSFSSIRLARIASFNFRENFFPV
jgi:hypothetical protein